MLANKENVKSILDYLDQKGVNCLAYSYYNDEDDCEENPYWDQYNGLFEAVVNKIYKHFDINGKYDPIIFAFFYSDEGVWYGSFYSPEYEFTIEKIVNDDYSELKGIKREIEKDKVN